MTPIQVVLADDNPEMRSILTYILKKAGGIEIVGEVASGREALNMIDELSPDVLILDIKLPELGGDKVAQILNAGGNKVRVLVLSNYLEKNKIQELFSQGVSGFIAKEEAFEWLVPAIQGVMQGQRWLSPLVERKVSGKLWTNSG